MRLRRSRGAAIIEAIIAFPIVVIFTLCVAQYAFLVSGRNALQYAAHNTARVAAAILVPTYDGDRTSDATRGQPKELFLRTTAALSLAAATGRAGETAGVREQWSTLRGANDPTGGASAGGARTATLVGLFSERKEALVDVIAPGTSYALASTRVVVTVTGSATLPNVNLGVFTLRVEHDFPCSVPIAAQIMCAKGVRTMVEVVEGIQSLTDPLPPCEVTDTGCP